MTRKQLRSYTRKELAEMAKRNRVPGWHAMRKEELIRALTASRRRRGRSRGKGRSRPSVNGSRRATSRAHETGTPAESGPRPALHRAHRRDLGNAYGVEIGQSGDQFEAIIEDAYWIRVRWSFRRARIARAEAALGVEWHHAQPVVRLFDALATDDSRPAANECVQDVEIHGDVDHWYIPVPQPGRSYRLQIGYRTPSGRFHPLAKSRLIRTPHAGSCGKVDRSWKKETKGKVSERVRRVAQPTVGGASSKKRRSSRKFQFQIDAELIVHGATDPHAHLTVLGEPVALTKDGRFSLRFSLPNGRLVVPAVSLTPCGSEQHTIVLAVERNTRELEPQRADDLLA